MPRTDDQMEFVQRLAESYRGIKFGRGVVGKTNHATLALFGLWAVILFRLSENLIVDGMLMGGGAIATCVYFWWVHKTHNFAAANPWAMLEGAELIEYKKWEAEVKGLPPPGQLLIPDPKSGANGDG